MRHESNFYLIGGFWDSFYIPCSLQQPKKKFVGARLSEHGG